MRPLTIAGIALALVGAFIVFRGLSYGTHHSVMKLGDVQVSTSEQRPIPAWAGGVAILCGVLLVGAGARSRRA